MALSLSRSEKGTDLPASHPIHWPTTFYCESTSTRRHTTLDECQKSLMYIMDVKYLDKCQKSLSIRRTFSEYLYCRCIALQAGANKENANDRVTCGHVVRSPTGRLICIIGNSSTVPFFTTHLDLERMKRYEGQR